MTEGLFSTDTITPLFRSLSQKRKSGVFEVRSPDGDTVSIHLVNGRIVSATRARESAGEAVCDRLVQQKVLRHDEALLAIECSQADLQMLWNMLINKYGVPAGVLLEARRQYEMESLYRLRRFHGSPYRFRSEHTGMSGDKAIDVAPGQFLLDLVELDEADESFSAQFGSLDFESRWLLRGKELRLESLSVLERRVYDALQAKRSLRELYEQTLMTEIELRAALDALMQRGGVVVEVAEEEAAEDDLLLAAESADSELQTSWKSLIEDASDLLSDVEEPAEVEAGAEEVPSTTAPTAAGSDGTGAAKAKVNVQNLRSQGQNSIASQSISNLSEQSFGIRLRSLWQRARMSRQTLLEHESVEVVSLIITTVFLWALALWVPWSIQRLLVSLDTFASASRPSMVESKN